MTYSNETGLPSPSDVLAPWVDDQWFTEESRIRGTQVHAACKNHLMSKYVVIDSQHRGYFDSFKRWCDVARPVFSLIEERLKSDRYGYSGQPDFVGEIDSVNGTGVADWKTSVALGRCWPIRIAAYRKLYEIETKLVTSWGCSIRLKSNGSFPLVQFYNKYEADLNLFFGSLNLYRHFNQ